MRRNPPRVFLEYLLQFICILVISMPICAESMSDFVSVVSDVFDGDRKFRVALSRESFPVAQSKLLVANDDDLSIREINRFVSSNGVTSSVLKISSKFDMYLPYMVDAFIDQRSLSLSSTKVMSRGGRNFFEIEASDQHQEVVYSGTTVGRDHFLLVCQCSKENGSCIDSARLTARSFELNNYTLGNPREERQLLTLGNVGVASTMPNSWSASPNLGTPTGTDVVKIIPVDSSFGYVFQLQIKGLSKKIYASYDLNKLTDLAISELSKEGLTITQNISRSLVKTEAFKGSIETHVVSDKSGKQFSYMLAVLDGNSALVSIKGIYPLLAMGHYEWIRFNTVARTIISNVSESR